MGEFASLMMRSFMSKEYGELDKSIPYAKLRLMGHLLQKLPRVRTLKRETASKLRLANVEYSTTVSNSIATGKNCLVRDHFTCVKLAFNTPTTWHII